MTPRGGRFIAWVLNFHDDRRANADAPASCALMRASGIVRAHEPSDSARKRAGLTLQRTTRRSQEKEYIMRKTNGFLIAGIIGVSVVGAHFGIQYGRAVWGNNDMWWTPKSMALPLSQTRNNFEVFVSGDLLQNHLDRKSLSATNPQGERYDLSPDDIEVRLNNWQKVKSSMLHTAVWAAFMLGVSVMSFVVGVKQFISENKTTANKPDAGDA